MKGRVFVSLLTVFAVCMLALSVPLSEGAPVNTVACGGVTVSVLDDDISVSIYTPTELNVHIHNDNPAAVTVRLSSGDRADGLSFNGITAVVLPGKTLDTKCTISADKMMSKGTYDANIDVAVLDSSAVESAATMALTVSVETHNNLNGQFNKFMGLISNDLDPPLDQLWFTVLITFLAWVAISVAAALITRSLLNHILKIIGKFNPTLGGYTIAGVLLCVPLIGIYNTLVVAGVTNEVLAVYEKIFNIVIILSAALIVWDVYKTIVAGTFKRNEAKNRGGANTSMISLFNLLGKVLIVTMCVASVLSQFGISAIGIATSAGIIGLGISLGAKSAIGELFAGLVVLITRPFRVGDTIIVGSNDAMKVTSVGVLKTEFVTGYTNDVITIPNSKVSESKIKNLTYKTRKFRTTLTVRVPYDVDDALAKRLITEAAEEHPGVVNDGSTPRPATVFGSCTDRGSKKLILAFYVYDYDDYGPITGQLRPVILRKFHENGIKTPMEAIEFTVYNGKEGSDEN